MGLSCEEAGVASTDDTNGVVMYRNAFTWMWTEQKSNSSGFYAIQCH